MNMMDQVDRSVNARGLYARKKVTINCAFIETRQCCVEVNRLLRGDLKDPDWAPRTVHPRTVPNRTEHFRAESPTRSEFSSASRTESRGECTVRYDSVRIAHSVRIHCECGKI